MHRELTGVGQFVDVSAVEVLTSMIGDSVLAQALTGERPGPDGNHHANMSPHGCYPCAGGDWISIAAADDAERHALYELLGSGDLADLTRSHDAIDLARRLRDAGVAAAKSATSLDIIADEMLWARGAYRFVSDHLEGQRPVLGPSWQMSRNPALIENGAPDLGEHNDYVFSDLATEPPDDPRHQIRETR
jgi:crotonobetainyl-CoA:carnitine CoA-transferase CaiB-like acyl-CoA transferase